MKRAACRPIAAPSMRTVVSAGCRSARELEVAEADDRQLLPAPRCRAPAPRSSRRARAGRSCRTRRRCPARRRSSSASARAAAAQRGRRRHDDRRARRRRPSRARRGLGRPAGAALRALVVAGDHRQPAPALARAGSRPPRGRRRRARSRPACRCGVGVRSQVSTTGMPAASRRLRPSAECMMPVSTMPSGRRPMMALEQRVLARLGVAALAEHQLVAALGQRLGQRLRRSRGTPARRSSAPPPPPAGCASRPARRRAVGHVAGAAPPPPAPSCAPPADTCSGVLSARDAVIGATPASLATSCRVTARWLDRRGAEVIERTGRVLRPAL